jgi:hypothetical protein
MSNLRNESAAHFRLKELALQWARENRYPIAATEVTVPHFRFRLDAAAYQPARALAIAVDERTGRRRKVPVSALGMTAIFECKATRPDYLRDSHSIAATLDRLKILAERKSRHEETLRIHTPSIRNGDSLFQEFETLNFERPGYEPYQQVLDEMRMLSARLHGQTKFDRLSKWRAASLQYIVAEAGLFEEHELPAGWGLLLRDGETLRLATRPVLHQVGDSQRLALLHRIAITATRTHGRSQSRETTG